MLDQGPDVPLDEYIKILAEYRRCCERRGNYKEAELVQHVLKQLRLEEENRHVSALTQQQENERQGLEEAHMLEFQNFNRIWNEKIDTFEEHQLDCEAAMLERHSMELAEFHAEMSSEVPHPPLCPTAPEVSALRLCATGVFNPRSDQPPPPPLA